MGSVPDCVKTLINKIPKSAPLACYNKYTVATRYITFIKLYFSLLKGRKNPKTLFDNAQLMCHIPVRAVIKALTHCIAIPKVPSIFSGRDICKRRRLNEQEVYASGTSAL